MKQGDLFTLTYDGSACSDIGLGVSTVIFHYHMYGAHMGTLNVTNAAGEVVWSLSGNQGDSWQSLSTFTRRRLRSSTRAAAPGEETRRWRWCRWNAGMESGANEKRPEWLPLNAFPEHRSKLTNRRVQIKLLELKAHEF